MNKFLLASLKLVGKIAVFALQAFAAFASDEGSKSRHSANKAYELYKDRMITGAEYAETIHGD